ncbi:MAG TPA: NifU family protein [Actinopolymorphaceae bacterium]
MDERPRLSDQDVAERLERVDDLLGRLEDIPGATAELALDAVSALAELYGEALARVMTQACRDETIVEGLMKDPLVGHLLVLHEVHPEPLEQRVVRALESVRPYVQSHGGDIALAGIRDGVATVRMSGSRGGCGASARTLDPTVREAVLAAAPELTAVEQESPPDPARSTSDEGPPAAFVPLEALVSRASTVAGEAR